RWPRPSRSGRSRRSWPTRAAGTTTRWSVSDTGSAARGTVRRRHCGAGHCGAGPRAPTGSVRGVPDAPDLHVEPPTPPARLVVLVSGTGTNLQALLDAGADPAYGARVVAVGSDRYG